MNKLRVGVAGCGIGREHIRAYQTLPDWFEVAAVCDSNSEKAQAVAAEFGVERVVTSFDALCGLDDLDVIDICTPSYLHHPQSLQGLAAAVYTQTTDVEIEVNGYLTYDRAVEKMDFEAVRAAHERLIDSQG